MKDLLPILVEFESLDVLLGQQIFFIEKQDTKWAIYGLTFPKEQILSKFVIEDGKLILDDIKFVTQMTHAQIMAVIKDWEGIKD
jgi:hypothetical protein